MIFNINFFQQNTVKILHPSDNKLAIGTGFFFHQDGYILTCYHVIEPFLKGQNSINSNDEFSVLCNNCDEKIETLYFHDYSLKESDIAVLKIKENSTKSKKFSYFPLEIHNDRWTAELEKITCFGYPKGNYSESGIQVSCEISGSTKIDNIGVFQIAGFSVKEVDRGFSGSPVICTRTHKVIGLIKMIYNGRDYRAFFVSITDLIKKWEKSWIEIIEFHDVYSKIRKKIQLDSDQSLQQKLKNSTFISLGLQRGDIPEKQKKKVDTEGSQTFRKSAKEKSNEERIWHDFSIKDLMPPTGSYLLSANVGFGKTTLLYWLTCEINKNNSSLALCIPCSSFAEWRPESWDDLKRKSSNWLKPVLQNNSFETLYINDQDINDSLDFFFNQNKIVFFYDGLDQVSGVLFDHPNIVRSMLRIAGQNKTVISSRPSTLVHFEHDPNFTFLRLMQFSKEDERKYFGKYFGTISSIRALAPELKTVPMLAFMVKTLAINGNICEVRNRADLYERFINHIFTQQNPITLDGQIIKVKEELEKISFESLNEEIPSIQIIPLDAKYINRDSISSVLKYGLVNFILEDGKNFLYFTHTSFQEYLAAKFIENSDNRDEYIHLIISKASGDKWRREQFNKWHETIRFLAGIRGNEIISKILDLNQQSEDDSLQLPSDILFFAAEILPEVKNIDMAVYEKIYSDLHIVKTSWKDRYPNVKIFIVSLIYLSRVQGLKDSIIKRNVIDIINCLIEFDENTKKNTFVENIFDDEIFDLIYENDSNRLTKLAQILRVQKLSTRSLHLVAFKEELLRNN